MSFCDHLNKLFDWSTIDTDLYESIRPSILCNEYSSDNDKLIWHGRVLVDYILRTSLLDVDLSVAKIQARKKMHPKNISRALEIHELDVHIKYTNTETSCVPLTVRRQIENSFFYALIGALYKDHRMIEDPMHKITLFVLSLLGTEKENNSETSHHPYEMSLQAWVFERYSKPLKFHVEELDDGRYFTQIFHVNRSRISSAYGANEAEARETAAAIAYRRYFRLEPVS